MLMPYRASSEFVRTGRGAHNEIAQLVEHFAFEYGETYDAYLATEPDREYFMASHRQGAVAFHRRGRHLIATDFSRKRSSQPDQTFSAARIPDYEVG